MYPQTHVTEPYVSSPPALLIVDEAGNYWALGFRMGAPDGGLKEKYETRADAPRGEFAFNVLKNGQNTGEFASRIERRQGKIRIFTRSGWKWWNGRNFV